MVEVGFPGHSTLVQSCSFWRTAAAMFLTPEHSQFIMEGPARLLEMTSLEQCCPRQVVGQDPEPCCEVVCKMATPLEFANGPSGTLPLYQTSYIKLDLFQNLSLFLPRIFPCPVWQRDQESHTLSLHWKMGNKGHENFQM